MNNIKNIDFINQTEVCPNCGNDFFSSYGCKNCGYMILENKNEGNIKNIINDTILRIDKLLPIIKKYKFVFGKFESYKIEVFGNKIKKIYFIFNENKFLVLLDYDLIEKRIIEEDFYETDLDDRIKKYFLKKIKNIKIISIQKKVKVGFDERKKSGNYYRYLGLNENLLIHYIFNLLKNFHN